MAAVSQAWTAHCIVCAQAACLCCCWALKDEDDDDMPSFDPPALQALEEAEQKPPADSQKSGLDPLVRRKYALGPWAVFKVCLWREVRVSSCTVLLSVLSDHRL